MRRRILVCFTIGLVPWLAACLTSLAWGRFRGSTDLLVQSLFGTRFILLPVAVAVLSLVLTLLAERLTSSLMIFKARHFAWVSTGAAILAASAISATSGEVGLALAGVWVTYSGYLIFVLVFSTWAAHHFQPMKPMREDTVADPTHVTMAR